MLPFVDEHAKQVFERSLDQTGPCVGIMRVHESLIAPTAKPLTDLIQSSGLLLQDTGDRAMQGDAAFLGQSVGVHRRRL